MESRITRTVSVVLAAGAFSAMADDMYRNDFAVRESTKPLPRMTSYRLDYVPGNIAYNYTVYPDALTPYSSPENMQDNWVKTYFSGVVPMSYGYQYKVIADGEARYLGAYTSSGNTQVTAVSQPFGREIHTGILKLEADFRAPTIWQSNFGTFRLWAAPRSVVTRVPGNSSAANLACIGICTRRGKSTTQVTASGTSWQYDTANNVAAGDWVRMAITIDFSARTAFAEAWPLGASAPGFSSVPGSRCWTQTLSLNDAIGTAADPIAGLLIQCDRAYFNNASAPEKMPVMDNIRASWKSSADGEFEVFYENDFSTRVIVPAASPSASGAYSVTQSPDPDVFRGYHANPATDSFTEGSFKTLVFRPAKKDVVPIPDDVDGWHRYEPYGFCDAAVVDMGDAGSYALRMWAMSGRSGFDYGTVSHSLGETITSGKVRLQADVRSPNNWGWTAVAGRINVGLANAYMYTNGTRSEVDKGTPFCAASAGVGSYSSGRSSGVRPYGGSTAASTDDVELAAAAWYRVVVTVDLDAKTYDYDLYSLGTSGCALDSTTPETPVYSRTALPFIQDVDDVGAVYVQGYGLSYKNTKDSSVYADNIKVWKNAGAADECLIYSNDFNTRTRYNAPAREEGVFSGIADIVGSGTDGWVTRAGTLADVAPTLSGISDPCVRFGAYHPAWAVLDAGAAYRKGRMKLSVDIRPPVGGRCVGDSKPFALAAIGDGDFWQGVHAVGGCAEHLAAAFGFSAEEAAVEDTGIVRSFKFCASDVDADGNRGNVLDSAEVTAGNWYRFRADVDFVTEKYSVKVFDMGAARPASSTADGELVATFADLGFAADNGGLEISAIGLGASGIDGDAYRWKNAEDEWAVLFDNLSFETKGPGTVFLIR